MPDWRAREWEAFGRSDPYFGVLTAPRFRDVAIDDVARAEFFATGEADVRQTMDAMRQLVGESFAVGRVLDFGCGVGRLTLPLGRRATTVTGVDVSASMVSEARANCARAGMSNVEFLDCSAGLDDVIGPFDFIHSLIVFQHIPPAEGYRLLEELLARLAPSGSGMLHFTFARIAPLHQRIIQGIRRSSRAVHRVLNLVQGRPFQTPLMAMYEYDLARIIRTLHAHGCRRTSGWFTDHGGHLGIAICFAR